MVIVGLSANAVAALVQHKVSNKLLVGIGAAALTVSFTLAAAQRDGDSYWAFSFPALCLCVIGVDFQFIVSNVCFAFLFTFLPFYFGLFYVLCPFCCFIFFMIWSCDTDADLACVDVRPLLDALEQTIHRRFPLPDVSSSLYGNFIWYRDCHIRRRAKTSRFLGPLQKQCCGAVCSCVLVRGCGFCAWVASFSVLEDWYAGT
jgi:hypothetical protein